MDPNGYLPTQSQLGRSHAESKCAHEATRRRRRSTGRVNLGIERIVLPVLTIAWFAVAASPASASHQGHDAHVDDEAHEIIGTGHAIPGAPFQVFVAKGKATAGTREGDESRASAAVQTVVDAFTHMMQHRPDYPRFDEAL